METSTRTTAFGIVRTNLLLGLTAIVLLISHPLMAQTDPKIIYVTVNRNNDREIQVVDTVTGQSLASAVWEGNWWTSAFSPNSWQIAINDNSGNLQILDLNTGTQTELPAEVYVGPIWSPDGQRIAFTGPEDAAEDDAIKILDLATGETQTLAESASYILAFAWSPDGSEIAFSNVSTNSLGIVNIEDEEIRYLLDDISSWSDLVWSPDGTEIALFDHDSSATIPTRIRLINTETGETRLDLELDQHALDPKWSPDGTRIVFAIDDLYFLDVSTGEISRVAEIEGYESLPQWSPDGHEIAFIANPDRTKELYVLTVATGEMRQLTDSDNPFEPRAFAWINMTRHN